MKKVLFLLPVVIFCAFAFTTPAPITAPNGEIPADIKALLDKNNCSTCHALERKMVGPMWTAVAEKGYSVKKISALVAKPKPENWPGYSAMAAQKVPKDEMTKIANWIVSLNQK
jgi:cytochrome c